MGHRKSDIDLDKLEVLYKQGLTYTQMGRILKRSNGAISFQIHTLKKLGRIEYRKSIIPPKAEQKKRHFGRIISDNSLTWKSFKSLPMPPWEYVSDTGKTILDLKPRDCRWPCKDNLFCGKLSERGFSYCAEHQKKSEGRNDRSNPVV